MISPKVLANFAPLLDEVGKDFVARVHKKIARSDQNKWSADLSQELFKYALECKIVLNSHSIKISEIFNLLCRLRFFYLSLPPLVSCSGELCAVWRAVGIVAGLH